MIDHASAQGKLPADHRIGQVDAAAADDLFEDGAVPRVEVSRLVAIAKADGAQSNRCKPLQSRFGVNSIREKLGQSKILPNRLLKGAQAVVAQGEPQAER